jgi:hypothetical protein
MATGHKKVKKPAAPVKAVTSPPVKAEPAPKATVIDVRKEAVLAFAEAVIGTLGADANPHVVATIRTMAAEYQQ